MNQSPTLYPLSATAARRAPEQPVQIAAAPSSPAGARSGQAELPIRKGGHTPAALGDKTTKRALRVAAHSATQRTDSRDRTAAFRPGVNVCARLRMVNSDGCRFWGQLSNQMRDSTPISLLSAVQRLDAVRPRVPVLATVRKYLRPYKKSISGAAGREARAVANQPLLTTRTLEAVQRLQNLFARQSADRVIDLEEQRAIRRELAIVEGAARHADNCGRYAMAVLRDVSTVGYLETLRMRAGAEDMPWDAA